MPRPIRQALLAIVCIAAGPAAASAGDSFDTSTLPRIAGAKETFASAPTTIYISPESVARSADLTRGALTARGWQEYTDPFSRRAENPDMSIMSFKNGWRGLNVYIAVAPAQRNATSVSYTAVKIANDLPFPKDADEIKFAPNRPHLNLVTAMPIGATLSYYRTELGTLGWALWSGKDSARAAPDSEPGIASERSGHAIYVKDRHRPLLLTLNRRDDGRTGLELKAVPTSILVPREEQTRQRRESEQDATARSAAQTGHAQAGRAFDRAADAIIAQALTATAEALRHPQAGLRSPHAAESGNAGAPLRARAGGDAPIPLPDQADDVKSRGSGGTLEFSSTASVAALAAFYRSQMRPLGWTERPSAINRDNMVVLNYRKAGKDVSLTIMQFGPKVRVTARGSALAAASAKSETPAGSAQQARSEPQPEPAAAANAAPLKQLEGEEQSGLPVPKSRTTVSTERTLFRIVLRAKAEADVASVLNFYRTELAKRDWKEDAKRAAVTPSNATLSYASPEGPATLKLERDGDKTDVTLSLRRPEAAKKAGLLPKPGRVTIAFGNMSDGDAVVTVGKVGVKIRAGVGAKKPDGPTLDLPPGKHKVTLKVAGKPDESEDILVGADETWALLVGPGGLLPMQVY
jgi:hypothetical protein